MDGLQSRMENFPRDVMHNILSRLPLKHAIRSTSVCKSWLGIIRDPAFAKLHFSQSESEPTLLILTHNLIGQNNVINMSCIKNERLKLVASQTAIVNMISLRSWSLVGTCDGLLCFSSFGPEELVMVCNPVTRENIILPKPVSSPGSCRVMHAFGFDPIGKRYKVVRILCHRDTEITAEVYTLGDTGSWRKVRGFDCAPHGRAVYAYGAVHWLVQPQQQDHHHQPHHYPYFQQLHAHQQNNHVEERILSFDLGDEEFRTMTRVIFVNGFVRSTSLVELGKCLAVVDTSSTTLVEISVLKDFSEGHWEKEYILPVRKPRRLDRESPSLICAREHDGVLLIWLQYGLFSYKSKGFVRRDLKLARFPTWLDWEISSVYRASLVSLSQLNVGTGIHGSAVGFVSDAELYSIADKDVVVTKQDALRRCDSIVNCFQENGMLIQYP